MSVSQNTKEPLVGSLTPTPRAIARLSEAWDCFHVGKIVAGFAVLDGHPGLDGSIRLSTMHGSRHRLREMWPVRTRLSSSRKSMSRLQCRPYSIQCAFAVANRCWASGIGRDEIASFDADLISHPLFHSHQQKTARVGPVPLQVHVPQMLRVADGARPRRISTRS